MPSDLPRQLRTLCEEQSGVVARSQILDAGLTKDIIYPRIHRGSWRRMHPGVFATFSGPPSREATLWAALLYAGHGAMLSHQTAAELWKLADAPSSLIHVTVPGSRRVRRRPGIVIHLSCRAAAAAHPARNLPRTRLDQTVIDLWETAQTLDDAVGWVTSALGRRFTTQENLREAMEGRARLRWRGQLAELLSADAAGIHSVLEYRYVRYVERPHGLSGAKRQARARRNGRNEYRDLWYENYGMAVELDGRIAHSDDTRWRDIRRDNAAAAMGVTTLRYGWHDVTTNPCQVAAEIAEVLAARGYTRARPCSAGCPVRPQPVPPQPVRMRRSSELTAATCRVPARPASSKRARDRPRARQRSTRLVRQEKQPEPPP